ncbi:hypothetical protein ACWDKQ_11785 [Saccharopolyspora sp. NPDC000995]
MSNESTLQGTVAAGFDSVRGEFAALGGRGRRLPGQLVSYGAGERVVALWGPDITGELLTGVFSSTKGAA